MFKNFFLEFFFVFLLKFFRKKNFLMKKTGFESHWKFNCKLCSNVNKFIQNKIKFKKTKYKK